MKKKIAIIGAGGHGKVIGDIAKLNDYSTIHFFDDKINEIKNFPFKLVDNFKNFRNLLQNYNEVFVAIGDNYKRKEKIEWLKKKNINLVTLIHPKSTVSNLASIEMGSCVMPNAVINPGTKIKTGVIINTSASVDHDCIIQDFAHLSPNCGISGGVKIGKLTHLGTGTSVHPGISIGNKVKIGIGSRVFKDISDNTIYKG